MGPYKGGQAVSDSSFEYWTLTHTDQEYVRVPFADFNALKLPSGTANEADFSLLADIFPTVCDRELSFS
jgi:hypothetical protein